MSRALPADYHVHTFLCKHAEGTPADYVAAAKARGIPEICFADHVPAPDGYDPGTRMDIGRFPEYVEMVSALRAGTDPEVLFGIEADYYEGCRTFLESWLPEQDFDLVLGSVHFIAEWGFDHPDNIAVWETVDVAETWRKYFELVGALADTGLFDILGHTDIPKKFGHRLDEKTLAELAEPALDRVATAGMAVELNTGGLRYPAGEIYPSRFLLELCRARDIPIVFGSDAHAADCVGHAFEQAVKLAADTGYTESLRFRGRKGTPVPLPRIQSTAT
ncbi:histidinol-phosphatase HisJ family protein [Verrucomicrobiota bacterium]